ncbi:serine/threonine protein kinase [mine drainage metagenome]|uniref:Serine/threonine protein kinase n=1 Tax=mine drainage metagenome TaxID=410659 RepID=A0A1J5RDN3_9ZZZZ
MTPAEAPYADLTPERVLDAVDAIGLRSDGRLLQLNSFENRVYLVGLDDGSQCVAKFYRPARWSDAAIVEEHDFCAELVAQEIPAVAPWAIGGATLHRSDALPGHRYAVFPRQGGRSPELEDEAALEWLGRYLGRIHAVGAARRYQARPALDVDSYGVEARDAIVAGDWLPLEARAAWIDAADRALDEARRVWARVGDVPLLRLHGDCHVGNVLWTDSGPHFVDFDDSRTGPAVQDLWMLLTGEGEQLHAQLGALLRGYRVFADFDRRQLLLVEPLRTLRLVHYSAWIARRWHDPAFPAAFPWFGSSRYWQERTAELRAQLDAMREPPLLAD